MRQSIERKTVSSSMTSHDLDLDLRAKKDFTLNLRELTRQAVHNVNSVFVTQMVAIANVGRWFKKLRSEDFDLSYKPRD